MDEVFLANGTVERDTEDPNLIWKTVLTPGRLELTPGANGKRVEKPLIIIEGKSSDPMNVIGLEDLYDAYNDGAFQHVTIPLSHKNELLENTGFAKKVRWGNENGQKVLQAAFLFTEPEIRDRVERGTIADVSCGILKRFRRQRDGKIYPAAIEHIALTNKPWVDGMSSFTKLSDDEELTGYFFSDQMYTVDVPVIPEPELPPLKKAAKARLERLSTPPVKVVLSDVSPPMNSLKLASARRRGIDLAISHEHAGGQMFDYVAKGVVDISNEGTQVHWDDRNSMVLRQHDLEDTLDTEFPDCMLVDYTVGKALVTDENGQHWVLRYSVDDNGDVDIHPREEWQQFTPNTTEDQD